MDTLISIGWGFALGLFVYHFFIVPSRKENAKHE